MPTILLGGDGAGLMACFVLVAFCGLLRPLDRRARIELELPRRARQRPETPATPTVRLTAIELGLLAELSREQARAHEEVINDTSQRPETRRRAAATAMAWRDRAREFQLQARLQGPLPIVPGEHPSLAYTGPERRTQARRRQTRRTDAHASGGAVSADRRCRPDRRRGDRRRPELVPR